ncbi:mitochondrial ornithine transporter 1-like [Lucilia cuprina]|uniref:mitochondrial ornithine transporter 1-like n=1 Tax=Lucilia cuprina TaxID=7375 RepID=UPI001F0691BF|nr:mitochondrial ornithine transporter 1-like [Lucilia cuprina]
MLNKSIEMSKQNKNSSSTNDTFQNNVKTIKRSYLQLTYLDYLKQQYAKEFVMTMQVDHLKDGFLKGSDKWKPLENIHKIRTINHLENKIDEHITEKASDEAFNKPLKKSNIFKDIFRFKTKKPIDKEIDGFVWLEDPQDVKKNYLRWKLRKYFLQDPELDKAKHKDGEDYMFEDFVLVEPDIQKNLKHDNKLKNGLIDFTAGSLGGIAQVYVSQPLDTVKVKQQTFPKLYKNMFKCFLHTYRKDGLCRGLYAGTLPAVVSSVAENSVLFAAYGACQKVVAFVMDIEEISELSALGNACAGFLAAFFSTFTLCPTELIKCKLQAVHEMKHYVTKGSTAKPITTFKLTQDIFLTEGFSGFYRGLSSTFARELPGVFFFFGSYEATREFLAEPDQSKNDIGPLKTMCAGAIGGIVLWTVTFPADVIKTRIQINNIKGSMLSVGSDILRKEGILAFYNGLLPSILKTIPATAVLFLVYEYSKKVLGEQL